MKQYIGIALDYSGCYYEGDTPALDVKVFDTPEEANRHSYWWDGQITVDFDKRTIETS